MDHPAHPQKRSDFVEFLLERKRIDDETAKAVRERAADERIPIGQVLVLHGVLSVRQVMTVLERQNEAPERRFGELAMAEGYLSMRQLEEALRYQANYRRHQIELVEQAGLFKRPVFVGLVVDYVRFLELRLCNVP